MSVRPLRAPRQDGLLLAEPSLDQAGPLLEENQRRLAGFRAPVLGRSLADLRLAARSAALARARAYHTGHDEPLPAAGEGPLLVAGHQPELYHPGVWAKSFVLHGLARRLGGTPLNFIVDGDTLKTAGLHVPDPRVEGMARPRPLLVPFDRFEGALPWEERGVLDEDTFASFPDRTLEALERWGYEPILASLWPEVQRQRQRHRLIGDAFAAARRTWERRWGCHNLEVPLSGVTGEEPFAWLACHLLAELPRLHAIYNEEVHAYRRRERIRSRSHPVPDLAAEGDWLEAPFWGWRAGRGRRERVFVREAGDRLQLRCGQERFPDLPSPRRQPAQSVSAWQGLEQEGYKLRTRALLTTLFLRLLAGDLFLHGLGGGKYDELTDAIFERFFGARPPAYLIVSATRLLPLPTLPASKEERRRLARLLHDLRTNPQRHLSPGANGQLAALADEKRAWIARQPADRRGRRERYRSLHGLTEQMLPHVRAEAEEVARRLQAEEHALAVNAVLTRRDYSFCLYPEDRLRPFLTQML